MRKPLACVMICLLLFHNRVSHWRGQHNCTHHTFFNNVLHSFSLERRLHFLVTTLDDSTTHGSWWHVTKRLLDTTSALQKVCIWLISNLRHTLSLTTTPSRWTSCTVCLECGRWKGRYITDRGRSVQPYADESMPLTRDTGHKRSMLSEVNMQSSIDAINWPNLTPH